MEENKTPINNPIPASNVSYAEEGLKNKSNVKKLVISIILIIVSLSVAGYVTYKFVLPRLQKPPVVLINDPTEFIVTNKKVKSDVADKLPEELFNEVKLFLSTEPTGDTVNEIIFTKTIVEAEKQIVNKIGLRSMLVVLGMQFPDELIRSLSDDYVLGYFTKDSQNHTFIMFKTVDFATTYDSMLNFEEDLIFEMRKLFGGFDGYEEYRELQREKIDKFGDLNSNEILATSTGTSTATSTLSSTSTLELVSLENDISEIDKVLESYQTFTNRVLQNTDSRVIVDNNDNVLFYYTFVDKEWLLFAKNDEVLKEIKRRITEKKLTR
jgi:hypothetical protein